MSISFFNSCSTFSFWKDFKQLPISFSFDSLSPKLKKFFNEAKILWSKIEPNFAKVSKDSFKHLSSSSINNLVLLYIVLKKLHCNKIFLSFTSF